MRRRQAAVLVPVYRDADGELQIVLIRRREGLIHGGQLAFPGGKREPHDRSACETALREAQEEIGLAPHAVQILQRLPQEITLSTGFRITPFLARVQPPGHWRYAKQEVSEVLQVGLGRLLHAEAQDERTEQLAGGGQATRPMAFYRIGRERLWGASYRILQPLVGRLAAGEWRL